MAKNILLPIDLNHSQSWSKALPEALALLKAFGGELHLLAVIPDFGMTMVHDFFPDDFEKKALERANAALNEFVSANVPADVSCTAHLALGSAHEQILKKAKELSVDLIVMASHDPDRVRDFLVGSNADRIVHNSPISVLVTRG